ncbi:MAG: hypothetical protein KAY24_02815 [Candidatus Eisenbacteria sp.]|nr:hypothetical protein [Candidatus Eisenbacteria bacterium]
MTAINKKLFVESVEKWWRTEGQDRYPDSNRLAILADGGGSNGSRCRVWKWGLQTTGGSS